MIKTRYEIEEVTQSPELVAASEELSAAKLVKEELALTRNDSVSLSIAYELALTQWARASMKFERLLSEALA
jgi:hypothetical protein